MTQPTCAVRCRIVSPDGMPVPAARVSARLNRPDVAAAAGYIAPATIMATAGADGIATLPLWPNALGATASQYVIDIVTPGGDTWRVTATVPNAANADLEIIADLPSYPGKSAEQVSLEAVQNYAAQAASSATAAAASADATASAIVSVAADVVRLEAILANHLNNS